MEEKESFAQFLENLVIRYVHDAAPTATPAPTVKSTKKQKKQEIKTETPIADKIEKEFGDVTEVLAEVLNASPESEEAKRKQAITTRTV